MEPNTYFDVAGQTVAKHPVDVVKLECRAHGSLAAGCFWQVHDFAPTYNVAVPAEGAVPKKSWPAYAGASDYKEFKSGELNLLNGLYLCMSTTEATKTLGTSNNKFAMLQAELAEDDPLAAATGVDIAGDPTTYGTIWADASGPKRLIRIHAANGDNNPVYLLLFAHQPTGGADIPVAALPLTNNETKDFRFGVAGRVMRSMTEGGVVRDGCYVQASTTAGYLTAYIGFGIAIYAEYL